LLAAAVAATAAAGFLCIFSIYINFFRRFLPYVLYRYSSNVSTLEIYIKSDEEKNKRKIYQTTPECVFSFASAALL
jgi:hypothetical protein